MSAKILIVGAGLGGLTAALALRRAGFDVEVHEAATRLAEVGAGLTLSRGAQQVFRELGIQDRIASFACPSTSFPFLHYQSGRVLTGKIDDSGGAPDDGTADIARQCHRADVHAALAEHFKAPLHLGHTLAAIQQGSANVAVRFANGEKAEGDVLIAADGVRSVARKLLLPTEAPRFTGQIAYRFLVDHDRAAPYLEHGRGAVYLGPERTFNRYTLRSGSIVNCVGLVATDRWEGEGWSITATREEIATAFEGWHPSILGLIGVAKQAIKWGIFDHEPLPRWSRGRVALLGDAAHAMLPFLGMGAAMAIEDAFILARAFEAASTIDEAFARYEAARIPRTSLMHAKSVEQGLRTQSHDPDRFDARNAPSNDQGVLAYDPTKAAV